MKALDDLTAAAESWGWEHATITEPEHEWELVYDDGSVREVVSEATVFGAEFGRSRVMVIWAVNPETGRKVILGKPATVLGEFNNTTESKIAERFGFDPPGSKTWDMKGIRDVLWILAHPEDWQERING